MSGPDFSSEPSTRPRWAVSTLGEPAAGLTEWMRLCAEWDVAEIELRALSGNIDLVGALTAAFSTPAGFATALRDQPAQVTVLSASFRLAVEHPQQRADLLACAPWAEAAGIPHLRVFDKTGAHLPWTDEEWSTAAAQFRWWREQRRQNGWRTDLIIEAHNAFFRPEPYRRFCEAVGEEPPIIFDIGHAVRGLGPESALAAWEILAPRAPRVHFKDVAPPNPEGVKHCLPGRGIAPLDTFFRRFMAANPPPVLTVEWERWWQPKLPPLHEALTALRQARWL